MANFNPEQRQKIYNGCIGILSTYFWNSKKKLGGSPVNIKSDNEGSKELKHFHNTLRLLYLTGLINELKEICSEINRRPSRKLNITEKEFQGEIQGALNVEKFIQKKHVIEVPRKFICNVNEREYLLPENIFYLFIVYSVYDELLNLDIPKEVLKKTAYKEIVETTIEFLQEILHSSEFKTCTNVAVQIYNDYGADSTVINEHIEKLRNRVDKNIIYNEGYHKLEAFYKDYKNKKFLESNDFTKVLELYGEEFDNKLYEIWLLEKIKSTFVDAFGMEVVNVPSLLNYTEDPVYVLKVPDAKEIKIYFQKSDGLVWGTNKELGKVFNTTWTRIDSKEKEDKLRGNLDIIITYDDAKKYPPMMIDVKNILLNETFQVSEKIYKLIGHLDNFRDFTEKYNGRRGMLIFRNSEIREIDVEEEKIQWDELYKSKDGGIISVFSINPFEKSCKNELYNICRFILREVGWLDNALEVKRDVKLDLSQGNLLSQVKQAKDKGQEELEDEIAAQVQEVIHNVTYQRFKGNEQVETYKKYLEVNHFDSLWSKIPDEAKDFLAIGELLFNKVELVEYSSAAVMYCKAIEKICNEFIIMPFFRNHLSSLPRNRMELYSNWNHLYKKSDRGETIALEIGKIGRELKDVNSRRVNNSAESCAKIELWKYINSKLTIPGRYNYNLTRNYFEYNFTNFPRDLETINKVIDLGHAIYKFRELRNLVAHIDTANRETLAKCRSYALGIGEYLGIICCVINTFK